MQDGEKRYVTTTNYELSTPGGSRCSEQIAIGMAIAKYPEIHFKDFKEFIIYGEGFTDKKTGLDNSNPLWPCGVCCENIRKIVKSNPDFKVYAYPKDYVFYPEKLPSHLLELNAFSLLSRSN